MEIQELLSDRPDLVAQFMLFTDPAQNVDAEKAATFKRQGSADTLDQVHVSIPTETTALLSPLNSHVSKRQVSVCAIVGWMLLVLVVIAFVALYLVNIVKIQLAYE